MDPVPTRYIDRDGAAFAYQVIGSGPTDLVVMAEAAGHLDLMWSDPYFHRVFERVATGSCTRSSTPASRR